MESWNEIKRSTNDICPHHKCWTYSTALKNFYRVNWLKSRKWWFLHFLTYQSAVWTTNKIAFYILNTNVSILVFFLHLIMFQYILEFNAKYDFD